MPATHLAMDLERRQYRTCPNGYSNYYGGCYSTWDAWARWLVLGLVIFAALVIFFIFSCVSARRRRKMGYAPYRGTGWAAGNTPAGHGRPQYEQPYYANNQQNYQPPPPAYGAGNDYYGRQNDVELQQPPQAYGASSNGYAPPPGPPPQKNSGIIR